VRSLVHDRRGGPLELQSLLQIGPRRRGGRIRVHGMRGRRCGATAVAAAVFRRVRGLQTGISVRKDSIELWMRLVTIKRSMNSKPEEFKIKYKMYIA